MNNPFVNMSEKTDNPFRVLTVGFDFPLIDNLWNRMSATGFAFSHILHPSLDRRALAKRPDAARCFCIREDVRMEMPPPEKERLAVLEQQGVPTIHNMIMSEGTTGRLDYREALAYASYLECRMAHLFRQIMPSVIIGGYDGLHSGIAMAVARKMGIPWFALSFTSIPPGLTGVCMGMTPDTIIALRPASPEALRALAERTLREFETKNLVVPAHLSANSIGLLIKRLPGHLRAFYGAVLRAITGRFDKYTQYTARHLAREYLRKRLNLLFLPTRWFIKDPPPTPYLFIGLHMQPESSIDVWAPFHSDQFHVIESIARATPPTQQILVKLHKSDADNYSRTQLDRLRRLPGVRLVSPFASSRKFIESASLVFAIQGNIALESALLGRPVLVFGDTKFMDLPSVTKVNRVTDLPMQIRSKLSENPPPREAIIRGFMSYLNRYVPGCYNNWEVPPSTAEIEALSHLFERLRDFVKDTSRCAG